MSTIERGPYFNPGFERKEKSQESVLDGLRRILKGGNENDRYSQFEESVYFNIASDLLRQHVDDLQRIEAANATIRLANRAIKSLQRENLSLARQIKTLMNNDIFFGSASGLTNSDFAALGLDPNTAFVGLSEDQIQEVIASTQRTRAKFFHPDWGGSTQQMQKINSAAGNLKRPSTRGNHKR